MSSKRLDTIADYARHGYYLRVDCQACGHVAKLEPRHITTMCIERGWSKQIAAVERRLKCSRCGERNVLCGPGFGD